MKKEAMNLKLRGKAHIGGFRGMKGKEEIKLNYNLKNKQKRNRAQVQVVLSYRSMSFTHDIMIK